MEKIKKEFLIKHQKLPVDLEGIKSIINRMENFICNIFKDNGEKETGIGFLCNIPFPDKDYLLTALITNNHV